MQKYSTAQTVHPCLSLSTDVLLPKDDLVSRKCNRRANQLTASTRSLPRIYQIVSLTSLLVQHTAILSNLPPTPTFTQKSIQRLLNSNDDQPELPLHDSSNPATTSIGDRYANCSPALTRANRRPALSSPLCLRIENGQSTYCMTPSEIRTLPECDYLARGLRGKASCRVDAS